LLPQSISGRIILSNKTKVKEFWDIKNHNLILLPVWVGGIIQVMDKGESKQVVKWDYEVRKFKSIDEILDFAISREIDAQLFYVKLAGITENPKVVKTFSDLANEELEHKAKLEAVKAGTDKIGEQDVGQLDIVDYAKDVQPYPKMTYVELLVVGMKKEETSRRLYTNLAAALQEQKLRDIFLKLAQEEAKHKLRFELEYDLMTF
jgi:rubrerythrin